MVYLVVALGQFGVILLTAMAKAAGLIVGATALFICVATATIVALHAAYLHFAPKRPMPEDNDTTPRDSGRAMPSLRHRRPSRRSETNRWYRSRKPDA